jgi:hypothetical protein
MATELKEQVGSEEEGRVLSSWNTTLTKEEAGKGKEILTKDFNISQVFRRRLSKLLKAEYDRLCDKALDISAPDFAVQAAYVMGGKAALQTVHRMIHCDPSK